MVDEGVEGWSEEPSGARPVVVGYNGKRHSQQALLWAAGEAVRAASPLLVVHAANYPGMALGPAPGPLDHEPGALDADQEVTVRGVSEALEAFPDLRVAGATEVAGPADALSEASRHAALVVVGTRGYGRVVGTLLGSVAFAVAGRARCPVIVVKGEPDERPVGPEHRVVVGTDGSEPAAAAVGFAADRAAAASAALEIVTCVEDGPVADVREALALADSIARSAAARVRADRPRLAVSIRVEDRPADRVLVDASADAGLVAVGTRGRGALEGMLLGSVGQGLISGAECPVAVLGEGQGWDRR
jgi:nucleotide-binding universal stress UspA family protein